MPKRLAIWLAVICGFLAGSCSTAPADDAAESAAVDAGPITTTSTVATSTTAADAPREVLRVDQSEAGPDTDSVDSSVVPSSTSVATTSEATPTSETTNQTTSDPDTTTGSSTTTGDEPAVSGDYFATVSVGQALPSGTSCANSVNAQSTGVEVRAENTGRNETIVNPSVSVDGADGSWNAAKASRVNGDYTGTTEDILRWAACKWGFDEDITRARAVTESSWSMNTEGDRTNDAAPCQTMGLSAPCNQSHGLLQVKGSVHDGTYPASTQATAFGVDYAMAWLRACYDGAMGWLGSGYAAGDEWGCVGAWFSGLWKDGGANDYIGVVRGHLTGRTWEQY